MNYSLLLNKKLQYINNCIHNSKVCKVKKTNETPHLRGIYNLVSEGDVYT